jgi:predicted patatin/cPLA2 family phospholipase
MRTLVLEGGGMRGAFTHGVLTTFNEHGMKHKFFDNYVGTSAGAFEMAYFLSDQIPVADKVWEKHITTNFIKYKYGKPGFDMDYMRQVLSQLVPLNIGKIKQAKQKAYLPLSDPKTLKTEYFCLNDSKDPINLLIANSVFPFFAKPVEINGRIYYDGGLSAVIPIEKANQLKSEETWVVCTTPDGFRRKHWRYYMSSVLAIHKPGLRKLILNRPKVENVFRRELEERSDLIMIRPEKTLPLNWLTRDPVLLKKAMQLGKEAAKKVLSTL